MLDELASGSRAIRSSTRSARRSDGPSGPLLPPKARCLPDSRRHPQRHGKADDSPRPVAKLSPSERADPGTHGDLGIAYKEMGLYDAAIAEFKLLQADRRGRCSR